MMRRQQKQETLPNVMSRQETAVWLGRALSTNEITLRVVLELLDVVAFQQAAIKQLSEQQAASGQQRSGDHATSPDEPDVSQRVVEKLTQWREDLNPVLQAVEDACQQFEEMLKSSQA